MSLAEISDYFSFIAFKSADMLAVLWLVDMGKCEDECKIWKEPMNFTFTWPCIVTNFFVIKPTTTRCTNFTNLFCHETLHVSDSSFAHHQEFIHCTLSNDIGHTGLQTAFEQEHMLLLESCLQTCIIYTIAECTVNKLLMMDRRTVRNIYCHEILHVSDSSSVHHQEFIHCTLRNGICHTGL